MTWNWTLSSQFKIVHWNSKFFLTIYFWNLNCKKIYSRMPFANSLRNLRWPKRNGKTQQQWFRHGTSKLWWNYRWPIPGRLMKSNQCEHCIFSLYVQQFLCNSCFCVCVLKYFQETVKIHCKSNISIKNKLNHIKFWIGFVAA